MSKKLLFNKFGKQDLQQRLIIEKAHRTVISFYQYHHVHDPRALRDKLYEDWEPMGILGRVYLAHEGINAQISVPEHRISTFRNYLNDIAWLKDIRLNYAIENKDDSFLKLKIKVRPKIVADGLHDSTFDVTNKGKHLNAWEFNELSQKPDTIVVDMRNHYESEVGHMDGAICPDADTFRDELPMVVDMLKEQKDKHIVMYCTGGIRCEKASAYLKHQGFGNVYQLNGGIIEYARQCKEHNLPNKFIGKNFVFDDRLGERISEDVIAKCHQCGKPCDDHTNCRNEACHILFIQCADCAEKHQGCCSQDCQDFIELPVEEQRALRKGMKAQDPHYKKGRVRPKLQELLKEKVQWAKNKRQV